MADKFYAWGEINNGGKIIPRGTVVTAKEFGDDWESLLECGAVSTRVFPKMPDTWHGSVRSFRMEQIRALRAGLDARDLLDLSDDNEERDTEYLEMLAAVEDGASR